MEMTVTRFKATCLSVIDYVSKEKTQVVITRHGKPAAQVIPCTAFEHQPIFGRAQKTTRLSGDLKSTGENWLANA